MAFMETYFNPIRRWMYDGIEATLSQKTVHTCALSLSVYTEIMGGLVTGNLRQDRHSSKNCDAFLPYPGSHYVQVDDKLKTHGTYLHK